MIQIKLDHLQKRLQKRPKSEYRKDLMDFEIEWIKSYQAYLRGELLKSEEICNKLIKTKEYQQRIHCKQLVHSIRAKIYFKTGRIKESIIESKLLSDVESSDELKSQTILRTSDSSSIAMWLSGYPDQAIETFENNERKHLKLNNIRGLITTYWEGIVLHTIDYNPEQVLFYIETAKKIEEKYSIMSERGFTLLANHLLTLVNIIKGQKTDIHNIDIQMEKLRRHTTLYKPFWKTLLAEAYLKMDQYENCSRCIDDALNISQKTGEIFYLPETHRINAELKLKLDRKKDAKRSYKIALSIAQENNAPMLELRALNSLCVNYDTLNKKEYEKNLRRTSEIMKTFDNKKTTFDIRNAQKILKA